jgi:hypothetical protein
MSVPPRVPKYRHYRPKNLGVVRLDGRDVYLGQYGSEESVERYNRVIAEWLASRAGSTNGSAAAAMSELGTNGTANIASVNGCCWLT